MIRAETNGHTTALSAALPATPNTSTALANYDAARKALAAAKSVDEVKGVHDKAAAMGLYARMAKDHEMEADAVEIRLRAARRLGQMMDEQAATVGKAKGGGDKKSDHRVFRKPSDPPTLAEAGIDKNLANQARKNAKPDDGQFEAKVAEMRERVVAPKGKRTVAARKAPEPTPAEYEPDAETVAQLEEDEREREAAREDLYKAQGADGIVAQSRKLEADIAGLRKQLAATHNSAERFKAEARANYGYYVFWHRKALDAGWKPDPSDQSHKLQHPKSRRKGA